MKNKFSLILLIITVSITVSSCTIFSNETISVSQTAVATDDLSDVTPAKGGVIRLFCTYPDTLNPITTKNSYVRDVLTNVFESLVTLNSEQKPTGALAESWKVSDDSLEWTFKIRRNVRFHDGVKLTASDAVYTIQTIQNIAVDSVYKKNVENIESVEATDNYTLKITLKTPYSFSAELMTFPILSKKSYSDNDFLTAETTDNINPIGTGPYRFSSYREKSVIILKEYTKWWKSGMPTVRGLKIPYIKEIDVELYKNGISAVKAIQAKNIDVAFIDSKECGDYFGRYDLTVNKYQNKNFEFISLNFTKGATSDAAVRQAISYSIDKPKIINSYLSGRAIASDLPMFSSSWLSNSDSVLSVKNTSKAISILKAGGWLKNSSGIWFKNVNGVYTTLELELLVNSDNALRVKVANKIANQLKAIGIIVTVKSLDWNAEQALIRNKNYEMAILGWEITSVPDISFAYSTQEIATGLNVSGYSNTVVDEYFRKINLENDNSKKKTLYTEMLNIIKLDMPYIGLYFYNDGVLYTRRVYGEIEPCAWNRFNDLPNWYLNVTN